MYNNNKSACRFCFLAFKMYSMYLTNRQRTFRVVENRNSNEHSDPDCNAGPNLSDLDSLLTRWP